MYIIGIKKNDYILQRGVLSAFFWQKEADVSIVSADDVTEISQEEAEEKASALLERLYGIDA